MMLEQLFFMILRGMMIGIVVSAPMGPVGIFCIQRTLDKGRMSGFYTGVGAAISDLIYCILTGFCLSFIEEFINVNRGPIQILGASVLIGFGIWLVKKKPDKAASPDADKGTPSVEGDILKGFALTFSNPLILFLIIGLFAQFNFVVEGMTFWHYVLGFIGIITGALTWWWVVTYFVDKLRCHFNERTMKLINTVVGVIILTFAAIGIVSATASYAHGSDKLPPLEFKADFRVADKSSKGWRIDIADTSGRGFRVETRSVAQADKFGDAGGNVLNVRVIDLSSGKELKESTISKGIDPYKGQNAWRLMRKGDEWHLFAGNRTYNPVLDFNFDMGQPLYPVISPLPDGDISSMIIEVEHSESPRFDMIYSGESKVADILKESAKNGLQGIYGILDYEQDDTYAKFGGQYRLALLPSKESGSSDIVYLGGARAFSDAWRPGMRKGVLKATPFANVYDVEWIDAEGQLMSQDLKADFDPLTQVLTIHFPYQNSNLKLKKETASGV